MSLSPDSAAQLQTYAQVAVGFAGFAGVIGAFSRFRIHAQATAFRVRAMVALALMEVVFSLLPTLIASFGAPEPETWRTSSAILAAASTVALLVFLRQARILYRAGRLMKIAAYAWSAVAAVLIAILYLAASGVADRCAAPCYFAALFFGIVLCAYHFIMVMIAVRLDDGV